MHSSTVLASLFATLAIASPVHQNLHNKRVYEYDIKYEIVTVTVTAGQELVHVQETVYVAPTVPSVTTTQSKSRTRRPTIRSTSTVTTTTPPPPYVYSIHVSKYTLLTYEKDHHPHQQPPLLLHHHLRQPLRLLLHQRRQPQHQPQHQLSRRSRLRRPLHHQSQLPSQSQLKQLLQSLSRPQLLPAEMDSLMLL